MAQFPEEMTVKLKDEVSEVINEIVQNEQKIIELLKVNGRLLSDVLKSSLDVV